MCVKVKVKFKYQHNHRNADEQVRFFKPWHIYLPDSEDTEEDRKAFQIILDDALNKKK